jgi:hypothetical protein
MKNIGKIGITSHRDGYSSDVSALVPTLRRMQNKINELIEEVNRLSRSNMPN